MMGVCVPAESNTKLKGAIPCDDSLRERYALTGPFLFAAEAFRVRAPTFLHTRFGPAPVVARAPSAGGGRPGEAGGRPRGKEGGPRRCLVTNNNAAKGKCLSPTARPSHVVGCFFFLVHHRLRFPPTSTCSFFPCIASDNIFTSSL